MPKGNFNLNKIIGINIKDKSQLSYNILADVSKDGFNKLKVGDACRHNNRSHKGYIWFYEQDYSSETFEFKLRNITAPHRKKDLILDHKICKKCNIDKSLDGFQLSKKGRFGRDNYCKPCRYKDRMSNNLTKLSYRIRSRLYNALKRGNFEKQQSLNEYLGCSLHELQSHLQSLFQPGMTWDNYGEWHIDHKEPLCKAKNEDEIYKLNHFGNLQPLWAKDNWSKGGR